MINPASIDLLAPDWKFGLGSKKQWLQMPGAPLTGQLAVMYCNEAYHSQIGISVITDKIGYTYTTDLGLSYAYLMFFKKAQLNMGVSIHLQNLFYDKSKMSPEELDDPYIALLDNNWWKQGRLNSDFGIEYSWRDVSFGSILFGIVAKNFIPPSVFASDLDIFPNSNYVYTRYRSNRRDYLAQHATSTFDFSIALAGIHTHIPEKTNFLQGMANINVHWNYEDYIFTVGLMYGTKAEMGIILGLDLLYNFSTSFIYQYNWSVRTDIFNPIGTFEMVLTYRFQPKGSDKPCKKGGYCLPERKIPKSLM